MLVGEKVKWDLSVDARTILNLLFIYSFIYCVLITLPAAQNVTASMGGWLGIMTSKKYGRQRSWPNLEFSPHFAWREGRKWRAASLRIVSAATEIRNKNIPKSRQKSYWLSELLLFSLFFLLPINYFWLLFSAI